MIIKISVPNTFTIRKKMHAHTKLAKQYAKKKAQQFKQFAMLVTDI